MTNEAVDMVIIGLIGGFVMDLIFGDPRWLYHPVQLVGKWINCFEAILRNIFPKNPKGERGAGLVMVVAICLCCGFLWSAILWAAGLIHWALRLAISIFMCYQLLAVRSLKRESMKVYAPLKRGDLLESRRAVSMIVGRDTDRLDEKAVTRAAVETVAENFSDGVIAPMFYMALGGPVLMFIYKGINTMDSMVGYKNEKYINFGRYAAKLDDLVNYIPSRIGGLLLVAAAAIGGKDFDTKRSWQIFKRDRYCHASPNSAQTEAAMAGALGVQLAGDAWYFGQLYNKTTIGAATRDIEIEDLRRANMMLYLGSVLGLLLFIALRTAILAVGGVI